VIEDVYIIYIYIKLQTAEVLLEAQLPWLQADNAAFNSSLGAVNHAASMHGGGHAVWGHFCFCFSTFNQNLNLQSYYYFNLSQ